MMIKFKLDLEEVKQRKEGRWNLMWQHLRVHSSYLLQCDPVQCSTAFIHGANLNALPSCPPLQLVRVLTCSAVKSCKTRQWCIWGKSGRNIGFRVEPEDPSLFTTSPQYLFSIRYHLPQFLPQSEIGIIFLNVTDLYDRKLIKIQSMYDLFQNLISLFDNLENFVDL